MKFNGNDRINQGNDGKKVLLSWGGRHPIITTDGFITKCDRHYKVRWLLQIATVQCASKMPRLTGL